MALLHQGCLILVAIYVLLDICHGATEHVLDHRLGQIRGLKELTEPSVGRYYYAFKGIPYAQPPVGDLRWKEPLPAHQWRGMWDARHFRSPCPQMGQMPAENIIGDEDCLYLNVYTPFLASDYRGSRPPGQMATMVFIHGGGFTSGSASQYGPAKLIQEDVVLVTVNYRLGALGFLSSGCHLLPGNYGLLDQILALEWVKNNIYEFGGDPNSVTIVGNSAGAASVHHLMFTPRAKGLFHRAIMESGNALCDWAVEIDPEELMTKVAGHLECSTSSKSAMVNCLRDMSAAELVRAQKKFERHWILPIRMTPVVDAGNRIDPVLPAHPRTLLKNGNYTQVPIIIGVTGEEGLFIYYNIHIMNFDKMSDTDYLEYTLMHELLEDFMDNNTEVDAVTEAVKRRFFADEGSYEFNEYLPRLSRVLGDIAFYSPHWETLRHLAATSKENVYSYVFRQRISGNSSTYSTPQIMYLRSRGLDHWMFNYGSSHVDELLYLFDINGGSYGQFSDEDDVVSRALVSNWVNFAINGYPEPGSGFGNRWPIWQPLNKGNINFYIISGGHASMGSDYRKEDADFWLKTVPFVRDLGSAATTLRPFYVATWALVGVSGFLLLLVIVLLIVLVCRRNRRSYPTEGISLASAKPHYYN